MVYCWKCGNELQTDAGFCPKCGASIKGTMGVQPQTGFELLTHDRNVQDHWAKRLIAILIDGAILAVSLTIIAALAAIPFLFGFPAAAGTLSSWWFGWWSLGWLALALLGFLYFVLAEALFGRTIGKELMGLRVERVDGKPMDLRTSLVRNVSKIHPLLLLLDVAVGLGTHGEMSQKWSDRYIGTKVEAKTQMRIIS